MIVRSETPEKNQNDSQAKSVQEKIKMLIRHKILNIILILSQASRLTTVDFSQAPHRTTILTLSQGLRV